MKLFWWKFRYSFIMCFKYGVPPGDAWMCAESWAESFGIDEDTPSEAVAEEISCWGE